ncbi:MAG: histidine kinase [Chitinophagales bacterium]|nr:histidine kinase [Chitinophagales bacterium]
MKASTNNIMSRKSFSLGKYLSRRLLLGWVIIVLPLINAFSSTLPNEIVYLNGLPSSNNDPNTIEQAISQGNFEHERNPHPIKEGTSSWFYIPGSLLKEHIDKNYLHIGFFDRYTVYCKILNKWEKKSTGGLHANKNNIVHVIDFSSCRLFSDSTDIAEAYLVKCDRYDDYTIGVVEAKMMSVQDKFKWENHFLASRKTSNRFPLPFWGMLIFTIIILGIRFFLTKDIAYLVFSIGDLFLLLCFVFLYYSLPSNLIRYPFDNTALTFILPGPFLIMSISLFILSFIYFFVENTVAIRFSRKAAIGISIFLVFFAFLVLLSLIFMPTKIGLINRVLFYVIFGIISLIYLYFNRQNEILRKAKKGVPYLIIVNGGLFIYVGVILGAFLSRFYEPAGANYIGNYHFVYYPLLIGAAIFNIFVILAFLRRDYLIKEEALELKMISAKYDGLIIQNMLNPHFIFNSLNLISFHIYKKNYQQARNSLQEFSDLIRLVIDKSTTRLISLRDELKILGLYFSLIISRKKDFFTYQFIVDEDLNIDTIQIPILLLQPIAENAIKHGIFNLNDRIGKIIVSCKKENNLLVIKISDNGVGINHTISDNGHKEVEEKHFGLELTRKRLLLISKKANLEIKSGAVNGTDIVMKIPIL